MQTDHVAIVRRRYELGLNQWQVAERAKIHQAHLSRIETGRRRGTAPVLRRIADALGVDVADITLSMRDAA